MSKPKKTVKFNSDISYYDVPNNKEENRGGFLSGIEIVLNMLEVSKIKAMKNEMSATSVHSGKWFTVGKKGKLIPCDDPFEFDL